VLKHFCYQFIQQKQRYFKSNKTVLSRFGESLFGEKRFGQNIKMLFTCDLLILYEVKLG
jgi:hypothetical protein